jgi:hypothetical protein
MELIVWLDLVGPWPAPQPASPAEPYLAPPAHPPFPEYLPEALPGEVPAESYWARTRKRTSGVGSGLPSTSRRPRTA